MMSGATAEKKDLFFVKGLYKKLITLLPSFNITDKKVLPYGLRPHTRSVSWIVEQVITQQTKYRAAALGLEKVEIDMPDTCLHDCIIHKGRSQYYVNVKIHNCGSGKENKNDIAAVEKLYMQYTANPSYNLIYACFGIHFRGIRIVFNPEYLAVFSPQFLPVYVNPRNDKLQAFYHHKPVFRSRKIFLKLLRDNSKSIVLK
jgi:hypothetical protein